jgi:hypothetical protein
MNVGEFLSLATELRKKLGTDPDGADLEAK